MADLITLAEYKVFEGITSTADNTRLTELIGSVSALIKAYCNNSFVDYVSTDKIQTFNIPPVGVLEVFLRESPVISFTSVQERQDFSSAYTTLTTNEYYYNEDTESLIRINAGAQVLWASGPGAVKVTYKAGYAALPEELKLATASLVTYYFKEQYKQASKNIGSTSLTQANPTVKDNLPGHIKRTLDLHRTIL